MFGSMSGNVIAVLYFLLFQVCGILLMQRLLKHEKLNIVLLGGSVLGSVLLQWMPVLFAFVMDFTRGAHVAAAIVTVIVALVLGERKWCAKSDPIAWKYAVLPIAVYAVFAVLVISSFEIRDGVVYSSQATYGDMSMHLGFITSITQQQSFPPDYSILPGTKLAYPFLSDSISSSLYIWGCDIRLAYMLPMLFAGVQVMYGAWLLFEVWLKEKGKALLAWVLYFLNGGFGFVYALSHEDGMKEGFRDLFHGFYQTPTNLVDENIRWVNVIVDIMLPQRASLFGYAVLFFALYLLYRAVWRGEGKLFVLVGILGGALPMIHTHSFLALVLFSGGWLMAKLTEDNGIPNTGRMMKLLMVVLVLMMQLLQWIVTYAGVRQNEGLLVILCLFAAMFVWALVVLIRQTVRRDGWNKLLGTWGIFLLIAAVLALPQLFIWTFGQATGEGFLRGYFNWANIDDNYLWFYIKNLGLVLLVFVPAVMLTDEETLRVLFPAVVIWLIAELVVFQPNVYDNNKLLYVGYLLMCGISADFMVSVYRKLRSAPLKRVSAAIAMVLCTVSAVLTIGRELVAEYQLLEKGQVSLAAYVMEHTEPEDKFLTDTRHNNAIAVLTGRNIQCGSSSYLYYHGLNYSAQMSAVRTMYEECALYPEIFAEHDIDYILISAYERRNYSVDESTIASAYPCVYEDGDVKLYRVK